MVPISSILACIIQQIFNSIAFAFFLIVLKDSSISVIVTLTVVLIYIVEQKISYRFHP